MAKDFGWDRAARQYAEIYRRLAGRWRKVAVTPHRRRERVKSFLIPWFAAWRMLNEGNIS